MVTRILAYLLALILLVGGGAYAGYHYTDKYWNAKYTSQIATINKDSADKLNLANAAKAKAEKSQADAAAAAKVTHDTTIDTLNNTIAQLRAEHVVLHDPGRSKVHHSTGTAAKPGASVSVVSSSGGTAISSGATDFLLSFAQRADTVRADLLECQADDTSIRNAVNQYNEALKTLSAESTKDVQKQVDKQ